MQLANYISDLLYRYDCVIVPNFGGFVTNTIGAKVNNYTHTFYPPTKQISFNKNLKHNDGLLANYIASSNNISFEKANEAITNSVKNWLEELKNNAVTIGTVGVLSTNTENNIVFEPNTASNFLTDSFGLTTYTSNAVKRFNEEVKPVIPVINTEEKKKKSVIPMFAKYAAAAAILLALGYVGIKENQLNNQETKFAKQKEELDKKIQTATFVIDNPLPTINLNVTKAAPKNYHIIAGAFQFPENAEKKVNQLKSKGFNAEIIGKNKWGLTQVTYTSLETRSEALQELRNIKATQSKEAWLLVKKLD